MLEEIRHPDQDARDKVWNERRRQIEADYQKAISDLGPKPEEIPTIGTYYRDRWADLTTRQYCGEISNAHELIAEESKFVFWCNSKGYLSADLERIETIQAEYQSSHVDDFH